MFGADIRGFGEFDLIGDFVGELAGPKGLDGERLRDDDRRAEFLMEPEVEFAIHHPEQIFIEALGILSEHYRCGGADGGFPEQVLRRVGDVRGGWVVARNAGKISVPISVDQPGMIADGGGHAGE